MAGQTIKLILLLFLMLNISAFAQESQKVTEVSRVPMLEPRRLIDCPTAGLLPRASFDFDIRMFPAGGVIFGLDIGLMRRFMVGMSFG
ncbi:MAG: hypothetical protein WBF13_01055, partial [Candidatus Zixiibacteriota bacterium]